MPTINSHKEIRKKFEEEYRKMRDDLLWKKSNKEFSTAHYPIELMTLPPQRAEELEEIKEVLRRYNASNK